MYERILVAVDGSRSAKRALDHAAGLAGRLSAALRIVHVVDTAWLGLGMELAIDTEHIRRARCEAGERLLHDACAACRVAGVEAGSGLLETGTPADRVAAIIAREAAAWSADVVVLGTHGRSAIERVLLGSVAEGVARLSPVPVLLVPLNEKPAVQPGP